MSAAVLVADLRRRGVELAVEQGSLLARAPKGALSPELRGRLASEKAAVLELLAMQAIVRFRELYQRAVDLGEQADAAEAGGDLARAAQLDAMAEALIDGEAGAAHARVLQFPPELLERIGVLRAGEPTEISVTHDSSPITHHSGDVPAPIMPVPVSILRDQPRPTQPCFHCGTDSWWKNAGGLWLCATCHPDPDSCVSLPVGIPSDGRGELKMQVLEEVSLG